MHARLGLLLVVMPCCSCADQSLHEQREIRQRLQNQEDSINAILINHFQPLSDGSTPEEVAPRLKTEGLDYMVGKSSSEFPDVFASAMSPSEIRTINPEWEPRLEVRDWMQGKESVVFLWTNIWKTIGMLENKSSADTLVIALDGDVIVGYKFFANLNY